MKQADEERFNVLLSWAKSHGGSLHPAVEVYKDEITGFSMRVRPDLDQGERGRVQPQDEILTCPLATSLSYLNAIHGGPLLTSDTQRTESSPAFPPEFMKLPPHVIGRFYLIQQYLLGKSSFWHPYIATLPQPDVPSSWSLPPFWPEEDSAFLAGTNTGIAAEAIRDQLKKEYKEARGILKEASFPNWQDYTRPLHNWAYGTLASRSFRPSLVISPAAARGADLLPDGVAIDDFSVLLPVFDIINHSMEAQVRWLAAAADDEQDDDHGNGSARACRFQTFDTYGPGEQVFNSYGKKTNSELLLSYGFLVPETEGLHNDYFHLRKKAAAGAAKEVPTGAGSTGPPQDFLVSLRPMNHPSSLAGWSRQKVAKDPEFDFRPEFAHVEDSLVWDLCLMVVGGENKASFMDRILGANTGLEPVGPRAEEQERECIRRVLSVSAALPEEVSQIVEQVKQLLLAKLGMEYDKLCETEPGVCVDDEGNEIVVGVEPANRNQEVAMEYRAQLKKVLESAISTLAPDWQD